jgi:hypothetical protein
MTCLGTAVALALIVVVFIDTFEVILLPRRVAHPYRLARLFYRSTWILWRAVACRLPVGRRRHGFLGVFGPLSLVFLLAIWAAGLITGFAILHWSIDTHLVSSGKEDDSFLTYLYFSGTTFFTLGYGDVVSTTGWGRGLSVAEAGIGFGFLAVVISYLPVLYSAFSRREVPISLLDARAGSPPSAGELLRRMTAGHGLPSAGPLLIEWERWSAELLESHLSFPALGYYRSQHDNQSWVGALTTILDTSALLIASVDGPLDYQARLTFAMARHAAVDLGLILQRPPMPPEPDRLPSADLELLLESFRGAGLPLRDGPGVAKVLTELRGLYEPFVNALAGYFLFTLPPFIPVKPPVDNWQTSPWMRPSPNLGSLSVVEEDNHFD